MKKFKIYYGLGGGFGGAEEYNDGEILEFETEEEANDFAYTLSCEEYDGYAGLHGLRDIDEIMEEDEVDYDTAWEIYKEERDGWLDYRADEIE